MCDTQHTHGKVLLLTPVVHCSYNVHKASAFSQVDELKAWIKYGSIMVYLHFCISKGPRNERSHLFSSFDGSTQACSEDDSPVTPPPPGEELRPHAGSAPSEA